MYSPSLLTGPLSPRYVKEYKLNGPTDDLYDLLPAVAKRIGALLPGGVLDERRAALHLLHQFREGKLGRITLDSLR